MYITPLGPKAIVSLNASRQADSDFYVILRESNVKTTIPCVDMNTAQYVARNLYKIGLERHQITIIDKDGRSIGY